jgi:hypothetical protein
MKHLDEDKVLELVHPRFEEIETRLKGLSDQGLLPRHNALEVRVKKLVEELAPLDLRIIDVANAG